MLILIKGAGDIATGIAVRLKNAGMQVVMTEIAIPTTVRRSVAFSRAVYEGSAVVENITAKLVLDFAQIPAILQRDEIPVLIDPRCEVHSFRCSSRFHPGKEKPLHRPHTSSCGHWSRSWILSPTGLPLCH